jgi:hypothetical protein
MILFAGLVLGSKERMDGRLRALRKVLKWSEITLSIKSGKQATRVTNSELIQH